MFRSSSGQGDADRVLYSGEGGGGLTIIDTGMPPPISSVAYRKSDGGRLDAQSFDNIYVFMGNCWYWAIVTASGKTHKSVLGSNIVTSRRRGTAEGLNVVVRDGYLMRWSVRGRCVRA